jgi:hypothetical protein
MAEGMRMQSMNVEHFAMMYGLIAEEAISRFGSEGEKAVREGIREYGLAYGRRLAGRAGADSRSNDFVSYTVYGEFDFSETGSVMELEQRTPHVVVTFSKCGWCEAWKRKGMLNVGRIYCEEIDRAIVSGFNPDFRFAVDATLTGGAERCRLIYYDGELGDETLQRFLSEKQRVGRSAIRPFRERVEQMYQAMEKVLSSRFGEAGRIALAAGLAAFKDMYGGMGLTTV